LAALTKRACQAHQVSQLVDVFASQTAYRPGIHFVD
jgi:hypothetical protein